MTDINWPENLNKKDKEIISSIVDDINEEFVSVYSNVKGAALSTNILKNMSSNDFLILFNEWSDILGTSYNISDDVMENLASACASKNLGADEIFVEFQKLRPFKKHNDFIANMLWRLIKTRDDGIWPETQPADTIINTQWKQQN